MEIVEALLVSASPCEPDRGSHGASEISTGGGRRSGDIEHSAQTDLASGLPLNAKSLVGSVMANLCGSHYPLHIAMVEVSSQRVLIDKTFSVPKCVRMARMSHHSHKMGTVPKEQRDDLSEIWGEELLGLEVENTKDHERQK